jgi:hypothetical protein
VALTVDAFVLAFPEFSEVDAPYLQSKIDEAGRQIDPNTWGVRADDGQAYLAAHLLALSPLGNAAKLVAKDGSTTYEKHYKRILTLAAGGFRSI